MRSNNFEIEDPQVDVSFSQHNQQCLADENRLNMEMLRVHATEKQRVLDSIWEMNEEQLCQFFMHYKLFPNQNFNMKELISTSNLKLLKIDGNIYFGQMDKRKKNGKGIYISKEGRLYEGHFYENQKYGPAVQIYQNGNLFIGNFLNHKKHGKGKFYWFSLGSGGQKKMKSKTIQYYDGQWWGGLPDGEGIHQKVNGDLFTGSFKNGLKHGSGSQHYGNGDYYKGQYINGLPEGFGEYLWSDGSFYKGDFKQGFRSGYGFWRINEEEGTQSYQGHYCNDKKQGYGVYEWQNGWTYKGNFENDYRNGYGQLYDQERLVYKGYWQNGEQTPNRERSTGRHHNQGTISSFQFSGVSAKKNKKSQQPIDRFYETADIKQKMNHQRPNIKMTPRPEFSIKKRPKSFTNLHKTQNKSQTHSRYNPSKRSNDGYTTIGSSISRPIMKINNLYVPWQRSSRQRR